MQYPIMSKLMFAGVFVAVTVLTFCKAAPGAAPATSSASTAIDTLTDQYSGRVKRQGGGGCGCCGCGGGCGCCGCGGGGGGCGCCCCRPRCCCCCRPRCCCRRCCTCCKTCCCTRCCTCCRPCCGCGCGGGGRKRRSLQTLAIKHAEKKSQESQQIVLPEIVAPVAEIAQENENVEQSIEQHSHDTTNYQ